MSGFLEHADCVEQADQHADDTADLRPQIADAAVDDLQHGADCGQLLFAHARAGDGVLDGLERRDDGGDQLKDDDDVVHDSSLVTYLQIEGWTRSAAPTPSRKHPMWTGGS